MAHSERFLKIVDDSRTRIKECEVGDVVRRLAANEKLNLIDCREESEYAQGRIPGAIHIGKGVIERDIESHFPNLEDELILYCGGGYRSALAADNLRIMGYTDVVSMDGGFRGWKAAGQEIES